MPAAIKRTVFTVTFPDGHEQKFEGSADMTDEAVYQRAVQERSFSDNKIPTSFSSGAGRALGNDPDTVGALLAGTGLLTGGVAPAVGTAIMAAAPTVARGVKYATEKATGQTPTPISTTDIVKSVAAPVLAYGPGAIASSGKALEGAVSRLPVSGLPSWAVKESAPIVEGAANAVGKVAPQSMMKTVGDVGSSAGNLAADASGAIARAGTGVSSDDLRLFKGLIDNGMSRQAAIKVIGGNNPEMMAALDRLTSPTRSMWSRFNPFDESGAAIPAPATTNPPGKVGNTSSSAELLARQQRDAVKAALIQRMAK